jgi:hypothetical protein
MALPCMASRQIHSLLGFGCALPIEGVATFPLMITAYTLFIHSFIP